MTSFLTVIAQPTINRVAEKQLIGKPYVRVGKLFKVLGNRIYQQGGVLGYSLRNKPQLLGRLAATEKFPVMNETETVDYFGGLSAQIASELEEVKDYDKTFFNLYTMRELRSVGIELISRPPDKRLEEKAGDDFARDLIEVSFHKGIGLGFNFPEQFSMYWNNSYSIKPDNELEQLSKQGLVLSEIQERRTLNDAIIEIAEVAMSWVEIEAPRCLDDVYFMRAEAYQAKGEKEKALADYKKALELAYYERDKEIILDKISDLEN